MSNIVTRSLLDGIYPGISVKYELEGSSFKYFTLEDNSSRNDKVVQTFEQFNGNQQLIVIDSINSGRGRNPEIDFYNIVMKPILNKLEIQHSYLKTTSSDSISNFAQELNTTLNYTIIFLSGDTSISEFINNLPTRTHSPSHNIEIVPIHMGSANALANSLELCDPIQIFDLFLQKTGQMSKFPLYKTIFPNGKETIFFIIFSMAFHANLLHLCTLDEVYSKLGVERFRLASDEILKNYNLNLNLKLSLNDGNSNTIQSNFAYFAILNTPKLEATYIPSPKSNPLRNELHILGYSSDLSEEELTADILKGYTLKKDDELNGKGITYEPITSDFDIIIESISDKDPRYMLDTCCDGILDNLNDMIKDNHSKPVIKIKFLKTDDLSFNIKILHK